MFSFNRSFRALPFVLLLTCLSPTITGCQNSASELPKATQEKKTQQKGITSVVVHVVGESFIGIQYSKRIVVTSVDSNYVLDTSCFKCKCPKIEAKKLEAAVADEFLKLIESLQDGGHMASCCDHPYTEVEIAYNDGTLRKLTLSFDISKTGKDQDKGFPGVEKVLKIECDTTKVAG